MPDIRQSDIFELFKYKAFLEPLSQTNIRDNLRQLGVDTGVNTIRRLVRGIKKEDFSAPHLNPKEFYDLFFAKAEKAMSETALKVRLDELKKAVKKGTKRGGKEFVGPLVFDGSEGWDGDTYRDYVMRMLEAVFPHWEKPSEDERQASDADGLLSNAPPVDSTARSQSEDTPEYSLRPYNFLFLETFTGRKELLDEILERLNRDKLVVLIGIGGIGKSRLAKEFAARNKGSYSKGEYLASSEKASSFRDIVLNLDFDGLEDEQDEPEQRYQRRLKLLRQLDERTLIVIDNVDNPWTDIEAFKDFQSKIKFHLIITSRRGMFSKLNPLWVPALSDDEERRNLFFSNYAGKPLNLTRLDKILNRIEGHTLVIELIAKIMSEQSEITLEQIWKWLSDPKLDYEYREGEELKKPKAVIHEMLFRVKMDNEQKELLYRLTFLPDEGVSRTLVREKLCRPCEKTLLGSLENCKWVDREGDQIRIHPVIREAVREDMLERLKWDVHSEFLEKIREAMKAEEEKQDEEKRREENQKSLCLLAWNLCEALHEKNKVPLNLWDCLSEIAGHCKDAYQHEAALRLYGFLSEIEENNVSEANKRIELHLDFGSLYQQMADYESAIRDYETARDITRRDDDWRASCYKSLGVAYRKKGEYKQAEDSFKDAIKRYTRKDLIVLAPDGSGVVTAPDNPGVVATQDDRDVITAQDDLGVVYRHLGEEAELAADREKSLGYYQKAKAIAEAVLALREKLGVNKVGEKALATSHHRVGSACYFLGKYKEALKEHEEALKQRQDRGKATSYNWIGKDLLRLGRLDEAKTKLEESLDIRKDSLGEHHPDVAKSLMSLGEYYERIGDLEEAINNTKEAHEICKERLGCEHLYTKQAERRREDLEAKQRLKKQVPVPPGQEKRQ